MGNLPQIKALVFALKGGSPGTEIVFLNQNLAIRPASIVRLGLLCHSVLPPYGWRAPARFAKVARRLNHPAGRSTRSVPHPLPGLTARQLPTVP
jgi:hypothetical protein